MSSTLTPQDALIAVMATTSAADERMSALELLTISRIIDSLPVFEGYDDQRMRHTLEAVADMLGAEEGLETIIGLAKDALPEEFYETAYALACDVVAADGHVHISEMRWLDLLRENLSVGRLTAAAIERAARARHLRLPASKGRA